MSDLDRVTVYFSPPSWGFFFTWHGAQRQDRAGCDLYLRLGPVVIGIPHGWDRTGQLRELAKDKLRLIEELALHNAAVAASGPRPCEAICRRCDSPLVFSARQRGDGLCGPCSRLNRPACVACGADGDTPLIWGFGKDGEAPGLMRVIDLCETCRPYAIKAALEASP